MRKLIDAKLVNDIIQVIANGIHPGLQYAQVNQVITALQKLEAYNEPDESGTNTQC